MPMLSGTANRAVALQFISFRRCFCRIVLSQCMDLVVVVTFV